MDEKDHALEALVELYQNARLLLIQMILGNTGVGTKTYYNTMLLQLTAVLENLQKETNTYIAAEVPKAYQTALDQLYENFSKTGLRMTRPESFAQIHEDAIYELCKEMQHHVYDGISQAGRRVMRYADRAKDDALRHGGLTATAVKESTGSTVQDMQAGLMSTLSQDGFLTVQYGSGKSAYQVPLETYTAMVARSTTREAGNLARENQLRESGYDLMKMTEHYPTCEKCAALQGRVYSISGKDPRFPPLSSAFPAGYRNVHPNCRHVMTYYIAELQTQEQLAKDIAFSGEPFADTRSDAEKSLYSKQQANMRRMRDDRSQYERYKQRLGDQAPKSFSAFRRAKNKGGAKWDDLQTQYKLTGKRAPVASADSSSKTVDKPGESDIINAGGYSGAKKTPGWRERHAEQMYEEVRHRSTDVKHISENTPFKESAVEEIKQHMFFKDHKFANGTVKRFDSDYDQVQAWDRLSQGKGTKTDIEMLKHEYVDLTQMRLHGYDYETAHEIANSKHNWWAMAEKE